MLNSCACQKRKRWSPDGEGNPPAGVYREACQCRFDIIFPPSGALAKGNAVMPLSAWLRCALMTGSSIAKEPNH
jgi:hypothetical protein